MFEVDYHANFQLMNNTMNAEIVNFQHGNIETGEILSPKANEGEVIF